MISGAAARWAPQAVARSISTSVRMVNMHTHARTQTLTRTPAAIATRLCKASRQLLVKDMSSTATPAAARGREARRRMARPEVIAQKKRYGVVGIATGVITVAAVSGGYALYDITEHPEGFLARHYRGSYLEDHSSSILGWMFDTFQELNRARISKVVPDWDPEAQGLPPGWPAPPLLVIDFERTLIASEFDPKYGWRHAKRPGFDRFIKEVTQMFEVIVVSECDTMIATELLDKAGVATIVRVGGYSCQQMKKGILLKDLDVMNRPRQRILVLDDNKAACQLCTENAIFVKPYEDPRDKRDTALVDLLPFLHALVLDNGAEDIPKILRDLGSHDAEDIVTEYHKRVFEAKHKIKTKPGLGSFIRGVPDSANDTNAMVGRTTSLPSALEIVGKGPQSTSEKKPITKKKGKLFQALEKIQEENQEYQMRKQEKMQQIQQQKYVEQLKQSKSKV